MHRKRSIPEIPNHQNLLQMKQRTSKQSTTDQQQQITLTLILNNNRNPSQLNVLKNSTCKHVKKIIYRHLKNILPYNQYKLIIGLQTVDQDYQTDYRLEEEIGCIEDDLMLTYCIKSLGNQKRSILNYKVCRIISVGGFSKVYLLKDLSTGKFKIGKFIHKEGANKKLIKQQYMLSQGLKHPFITKTYQLIETPNFYVLILAYYPGGQLFQLLKQNRFMAERHARFYMTEVILALKALHQKCIIYRDLKPQNIILDKDGHLRLVDFGLAKKIKGRTYSFCGSLDYMAPEMIEEQGHSFEADYYSLGNLLFEILIGAPPFYHPKYSQEQTKYHIINSQIVIPQQLELSQQVKDLLRRLLNKTPQQRLGYNGIDEILNHKWFQQINEEDYLDKLIQPPFLPTLKMNFDIQEDQQHLAEYRRLIDLDMAALMKQRMIKITCTSTNTPVNHQNPRGSFNSHNSCDQYIKISKYHHQKSNPSIPKKISLMYLLTKRRQNLERKSQQRSQERQSDHSQLSKTLLKTLYFPKKLSISKLKSNESHKQSRIVIVKDSLMNNILSIVSAKNDKQNILKKTSNAAKGYFKRKG